MCDVCAQSFQTFRPKESAVGLEISRAYIGSPTRDAATIYSEKTGSSKDSEDALISRDDWNSRANQEPNVCCSVVLKRGGSFFNGKCASASSSHNCWPKCFARSIPELVSRLLVLLISFKLGALRAAKGPLKAFLYFAKANIFEFFFSNNKTCTEIADEKTWIFYQANCTEPNNVEFIFGYILPGHIEVITKDTGALRWTQANLVHNSFCRRPKTGWQCRFILHTNYRGWRNVSTETRPAKFPSFCWLLEQQCFFYFKFSATSFWKMLNRK